MTSAGARIAITGSDGMVGRAVRLAAAMGGKPLVCLPRAELDVADGDLVRRTFETLRPTAVIHLAAYTAVDDAEDDTARAMSVNRDGSANVAAAARAVGARVVFVSTDYVFDGSSSRPYRPDDAVNPVNAYGRTKWLAEGAIREANPDHIIVRTSWVFAPWGKNFVRTIAAKCMSASELRVVNDQRGRPTSARDLADVLLPLAADHRATGTVHFANAGETTWFDLAAATIDLMRRKGMAPRARLVAVGTKDYPTKARRPHYSVLDTTTLTRVTGIVPRDWREALADTIDVLA